MAESVTLTSPFGAVAATPRWVIRSLHLERGYVATGTSVIVVPGNSFISVTLIGEQGHTKQHTWSGASADADIVALNKVNLSSNSLNKRILDRLILDGVISGTSTGSPD